MHDSILKKSKCIEMLLKCFVNCDIVIYIHFLLETTETAELCSKQIWHTCKSTTTKMALSLPAPDFGH